MRSSLNFFSYDFFYRIFKGFFFQCNIGPFGLFALSSRNGVPTLHTSLIIQVYSIVSLTFHDEMPIDEAIQKTVHLKSSATMASTAAMLFEDAGISGGPTWGGF